jgi:hypothetical protein
MQDLLKKLWGPGIDEALLVDHGQEQKPTNHFQ